MTRASYGDGSQITMPALASMPPKQQGVFARRSDLLLVWGQAMNGTPLIPRTRQGRVLSSCLIVAFFSFHLWLSVQGAWLQDDRYGWRMFHNVGFTRIEYAWIDESGKKRRFTPRKKDIVNGGHGLVMSNPRRWRRTLYSAGAAHESVKDFVRYMGSEERRPPGAVALEGKLEVRINDAKESQTYVYRYPEGKE